MPGLARWGTSFAMFVALWAANIAIFLLCRERLAAISREGNQAGRRAPFGSVARSRGGGAFLGPEKGAAGIGFGDLDEDVVAGSIEVADG